MPTKASLVTAMRIIFSLVAMSVLLAACNAVEPTPNTESVRQKIDRAQYQLDAFGGTLYGEDRGEWVGGLYFEDSTGRPHSLLDENVHGIIRNPVGIFVFTGLAHLGTNEGFIYQLSRDATNHLRAEKLGKLPGAPFEVHQQEDGLTTFIVFSDVDDRGFHYQCLSLRDTTVAESNQCPPPTSLPFRRG